MKRNDYISWSELFMGVAELAAKRSKDPNTQVGACIVNTDNIIVSIGYNGMPNGCNDDVMPWGRDGEYLNTKYPYVCHAELNAILNRNSADLRNCTMYVTLFPCNECAKLIIQSGIKRLYIKLINIIIHLLLLQQEICLKRQELNYSIIRKSIYNIKCPQNHTD